MGFDIFRSNDEEEQLSGLATGMAGTSQNIYSLPAYDPAPLSADDGVDALRAIIDGHANQIRADSRRQPPADNINTKWMEEHPTAAKAVRGFGYIPGKIMSNPWMERAGQSGAEIMTLTDNPEKATTGSGFGDVTADLLGALMGFTANPAGGIESAGAKLWGGAESAIERALPFIPKANRLPAFAQTGLKLGAASVPFEGVMAAVNDRPMSAGEMGTAAGVNALLGMGLGRLAGMRKAPSLDAPAPEVLAPTKKAKPLPWADPSNRREAAAWVRMIQAEREAEKQLTRPVLPIAREKYSIMPSPSKGEAATRDARALAESFYNQPPRTGLTPEEELQLILEQVRLTNEGANAEAIRLAQELANTPPANRLPIRGPGIGTAEAVDPMTGYMHGDNKGILLRSGATPATEVVTVNRPRNMPNIGKRQPKQPQPNGDLTREGSISAAKFTVPEKMAEVGDGTKVRSLGVSAMNNPEIHPDVKAGLLMETYEGGAGTYKAITNKETIAQAQKMIADDANGAIRHARENPGTALSNTIELEMVKKANAEKRFDDAIDIINEVSQRSTTQGQAIQSLRLWGKMSPEGMQKYYVNTINKVNKETEKQMGKNAKKLITDPKLMEDIKIKMDNIGKMAEGRERDIETAKVLDKIAAQVPAPFLRKVATVHTMAQLLNPKTAIRNIVGNVGFMGMENISGVLGAAIDRPLSLLTGKRTKVLPDLGAQAKGFKQGWKHGLEDALLGIDTSAMATKFDLPQGRVFRKGFMGKAETAMNIELRATDRAFYRAAYEDSLSNQMRAAKTNTPTEEMMNTAHLDGLYRTFQDENALTAVFVGLKKLMNDPAHTVKFAKDRPAREFGMGDFIVKYPRTPANLLSRGLAYSPAGFTKSLIEMARPLVGKKFDQRAFVDSFSRATIGSAALFGTGALLHKLGIITGKRHDDYDLAELQNQQGFGEYRINASALKRLIFGGGDTKPQKGDKILSYDWFQPQAIPLAIGADIDANRGTEKGLVGPLLSALATGINAFAEQPVVQGIETLFSGGYGDYSKGVVKVLETVPSSFIPTLLSQVRQLVDNQRRETYDPMKGKESINRVKAKIPGLASTLPEKYGTLGQPLGTYPSGNNTPFNVFLNPAFVNTYNPSPEVQRVQDIYDMTGATNQVPRIADKSITVSGKKFTLSGQERSDYQRLLGQYTQEEFAKMRKDLKPEDAAKKMQNIMTDANTKAKKEILEARGVRVIKKGNGLAIK